MPKADKTLDPLARNGPRLARHVTQVAAARLRRIIGAGSSTTDLVARDRSGTLLAHE